MKSWRKPTGICLEDPDLGGILLQISPSAVRRDEVPRRTPSLRFTLNEHAKRETSNLVQITEGTVGIGDRGSCLPVITWIYYRVYEDLAMANTSQKRAIDNYRKRLQKRGMARFEVLGLGTDRELIRSLAKRLADDSPDSARIRAAVRHTISGEPNKGGILNALRRSPLVGAELNLERPVSAARKVDL